MSGCKSCSSCSPERSVRTAKKAEKLEQVERSENPRYPHIFEGKQAIFSDKNVQMIVTVLADNCSEKCDCFTLKSQRVLKSDGRKDLPGDTFEVSQSAGDVCWKLRALI
ncbi:MAG TPA: hypothetical protein VK463_15840 [Desulfomonilaceae bacterium]|nr:hypothetical protein [Desulfomonilaceae bacterium]